MSEFHQNNPPKSSSPPPIPTADFANPAVIGYASSQANYGLNFEPTLMQVLYSPTGRIGRFEFWVLGLVPLIVSLVAMTLLVFCAGLNDRTGLFMRFMAVLFLFVFLNAIYCTIILCIKRIRDFNKTGWLVLPVILLGCIPYLGHLVWLGMFIICGFIKGADGWNTYGGDPTQRESLPEGGF
jgi:uncharacterized membrane protein YhaH (DUF805 family)